MSALLPCGTSGYRCAGQETCPEFVSSGPVQSGLHLSMSLAGRSWSLVLVKEQSCHVRQSGEGGRYDPVSGCVMFWTCIIFFCLVCSMFIAHGLAREVKGVGVAWSGEAEAEGGT